MRSSRAIGIVAAVCVVLPLYACGGRDPRPIAWSQPGDYELKCPELVSEVTHNEDEIIRRLPQQDQSGRNVFFYTAGVFLILPWFAMDLRYADAIEIRAYFDRNAWLRELGARQNCDMPAAKVKLG